MDKTQSMSGVLIHQIEHILCWLKVGLQDKMMKQELYKGNTKHNTTGRKSGLKSHQYMLKPNMQTKIKKNTGTVFF